jgi:hypothetical protein
MTEKGEQSNYRIGLLPFFSKWRRFLDIGRNPAYKGLIVLSIPFVIMLQWVRDMLDRPPLLLNVIEYSWPRRRGR